MKTFLKVLGVLVGIAGVVGSIYFGYQYNKVKGEKEVLVQQNAQLQSNIDAIGPVTTGYTVAAEVEGGNAIGAEDFVEMTIPVSSVTDTTMLDISSAIGQLYKIDIQPGTPITSDMIMSSEFTETVYEKDMVFDSLPLGLKTGDYIDIKLSLPYGETFIVIPHKRVEQVVLENSIIKVYLTPAQQALWESALRDKSLYKDVGLSLFVDKYVEPGVQNDTMPSYPVRKEVASVVMIDRNIKDKRECVNNSLRENIDAMLAMVSAEDGAKLSSGISSQASSLKAAMSAYKEDKDNKSSVSTGQDEEDYDNTSVDLNSDDLSNNVQEMDSSLETLDDSADTVLE